MGGRCGSFDGYGCFDSYDGYASCTSFDGYKRARKKPSAKNKALGFVVSFSHSKQRR